MVDLARVVRLLMVTPILAGCAEAGVGEVAAGDVHVTPLISARFPLSEGEQEGIAIFPVPAGLGALAR